MDGLYKRGGNNKQLNVLGSELEPCKSSNDKNEIIRLPHNDKSFPYNWKINK